MLATVAGVSRALDGLRADCWKCVYLGSNHNDIMRSRFPSLGGRLAVVRTRPSIPQKWMSIKIDGLDKAIRVRSSNCELVKAAKKVE